MRPRNIALALCMLVAAAAVWPQQASQLRVEILQPEPTFISGDTLIRADVIPADGTEVVRVTFFADDAEIEMLTEPPWVVSWDAGADFMRHLIRVEAEDSLGNTAEDVVVTRDLETALFRAEVEVVPLYVSVVDDDGDYIPGLSRQDFEVYEQGRRQEIDYFASEPRPMVVGLLIDTSGSMEGVKMERAKQGAMAFLEQIGEEDDAFVMGFDTFPRVVQDLTPNHRLLREAILEMQPRGATSLNLAIVEGADILADRPERRALVVLSDGFDTVQSVTEAQAVDYSRRQDVRLYTIGIFNSISGGPFQRGFDNMNRGEVTLRAYADGTGGDAIILDSLGELVDAYARIAAELRSQYAMAYRPDNPPGPGEWREIEVRSSKGEARTKPGYYGQ